ncbi:MAG: hypothetical protein CMK74_02170 [Pseudomonadales bacterium]|nr:hypothetical protein [Pseudomonadales bacterium]
MLPVRGQRVGLSVIVSRGKELYVRVSSKQLSEGVELVLIFFTLDLTFNYLYYAERRDSFLGCTISTFQ